MFDDLMSKVHYNQLSGGDEQYVSHNEQEGDVVDSRSTEDHDHEDDKGDNDSAVINGNESISNVDEHGAVDLRPPVENGLDLNGVTNKEQEPTSSNEMTITVDEAIGV